MSTPTTTDNAFAFLWGNDATMPPPEEVKLPESGGVSGMAGEWSCQIVYRFWHDMEIIESDLANVNGAYIGKSGGTTGAFHYFKTFNAGKQVTDLLSKQYGPDTVWRWEIQTANIVNFDDEMKAKFGDTMSYEIKVSSLMSKKNRHELHMIGLPSAIQSLALAVGLMKEKLFDYESLRVDPTMIDEAYQKELIGLENSYESSRLWKAREAIWAALGETDPKKYTVAQGGKFDTLSTTLAQCLNIIYRPTKIWARLSNVPDPRLEAVKSKQEEDGSHKRLNVPVIAQIWKTKAECFADLDITPKDGATTGKASNDLAVPEMWADYPAEWRNNVKEIMGAYAGKPMPVVQKALEARAEELLTQYGATPTDYVNWAAHV
jgi:hypothetical protein